MNNSIGNNINASKNNSTDNNTNSIRYNSTNKTVYSNKNIPDDIIITNYNRN